MVEFDQDDYQELENANAIVGLDIVMPDVILCTQGKLNVHIVLLAFVGYPPAILAKEPARKTLEPFLPYL